MTSHDLVKNIYLRLTKFKWLILLTGIALAFLSIIIAGRNPKIYSARSTVFPLTSPSDNNSANSKLSELIGGGGNAKSLSDEATINIEEVAKSRKTREAVVSERIPSKKNQLIATLLIETYNKDKSFFKPAIEMPETESAVISTGAALLSGQCNVKFNKNNLLEVNFSSTDPALVSPISYILIDKISLFYKELKIKKAKTDFDFTEKKVDSLQEILDTYDRRQIQMSKTTLFVPKDRLQYSIPKDNLQSDKLRVMSQRSAAAANREDALWRLQKVTPIIEILDKPEPPFMITQSSKIIWGAGGFFLGCILFSLLLISGILYKYFNKQLQQAIFTETVSNTSTTL